ncbi:MAG TPA: response regulator, partial [Ktedonobacterales bacterium]
MRILLVEDNRRLSAALKGALQDAGYAVDAAYDGPEGEAVAQAVPYDALILDVMLPGKDGLAV